MKIALLPVCASLLLAASAAALPVVDLSKPTALPQVTGLWLPEGKVRAADSSYKACTSSGFGADRPFAELTVAEGRRYRLWVDKPRDSYHRFSAALIHPDGTLTCLGSKPTEVDLAAGTYQLVGFSDVTSSDRMLLFADRPGWEAEQVVAARAGAPVLEVIDGGPTPAPTWATPSTSARKKCRADAHDRAGEKVIARALKDQAKRQATLGDKLLKALPK